MLWITPVHRSELNKYNLENITMNAKIDKEDLHNEWVHSREEDTDNEQVYRPASYDFPLVRGPRESFQLKPDGSLVKGEATASDSVSKTQGKWKLKDDEIAFYNDAEAKESVRSMQIAAVDKDKLVLKK